MMKNNIIYNEKVKEIKIGSANFCNIKEDNKNIYLKIDKEIIAFLE